MGHVSRARIAAGIWKHSLRCLRYASRSTLTTSCAVLQCMMLWCLPTSVSAIHFSQECNQTIPQGTSEACPCTPRACEHLPPRRPGSPPGACLLVLCFALPDFVAAIAL